MLGATLVIFLYGKRPHRQCTYYVRCNTSSTHVSTKPLILLLHLTCTVSSSLHSWQDFDPDDFYNMEEGMDKSQLAGLMTSSSHMPYILSRLNMSISSNAEEGEWVWWDVDSDDMGPPLDSTQ